MNFNSALIRIIFITVSILCSTLSHAQHLLRKTVTVNAKKQPLVKVLNSIGEQGQFHFSYTSEVVKNDSLVTLSAVNKPVKQVLDQLFGGAYQYREVSDHIIIVPDFSRQFTISGYVQDRETGVKVVNATVYEKQQFISTLTNDQGFYRLRLKGSDRNAATITVSKDLYRDTTLAVHAGVDQEMDISIKHAPTVMLMPVDIGVEKTWMGKFFLSSKQRMQSLNLSSFFADKPFQSSIVPGLGSHGRLDAQVVNKVSFNLLGGYAAGLNGVEVGSIFNIDKKDVQYVQVGGIFNVVGGKVTGLQAAGIHNYVLDTVTGLQVGGVLNIVKGKMVGLQAGGIYNNTRDSVKGVQVGGVFNLNGKNVQGMQAAGVLNLTKDDVQGMQVGGVSNISDTIQGFQAAGVLNLAKGDMYGMQVAGLGNIVHGTAKGIQVAGVFNYADTLRGLQFALVNVADTSTGISIGLLNIIKKGGIHQVSLSNNEITLLNLTVKTGTKKLYSIFTAGYNPVANKKAFLFGFGLGHIFTLSDKMYLAGEFLSPSLYLGSWEKLQPMVRLQPLLHYRLNRLCSVFAGPAFTIYYDEQDVIRKTGYRSRPGAIGWNAGITIF